jgi:hypothetical protein
MRPTITSAAPTSATAKKNSDQDKELESMNRLLEKFAILHLVTAIGLCFIPILFFAVFLLLPVKSKCQTADK